MLQQGFLLDNKQTFASYADYVIQLKEQAGVKHSTIQLYRYLMNRILPAIGYMKLIDIRPQHLNHFYMTLMSEGMRSKKCSVCAPSSTLVLTYSIMRLPAVPLPSRRTFPQPQ